LGNTMPINPKKRFLCVSSGTLQVRRGNFFGLFENLLGDKNMLDRHLSGSREHNLVETRGLSARICTLQKTNGKHVEFCSSGGCPEIQAAVAHALPIFTKLKISNCCRGTLVSEIKFSNAFLRLVDKSNSTAPLYLQSGCLSIPGHALHEEGLQRQEGLGPTAKTLNLVVRWNCEDTCSGLVDSESPTRARPLAAETHRTRPLARPPATCPGFGFRK